MIKLYNTELSAFGFLRLSLYTLSFLFTLLCLVDVITRDPNAAIELNGFWPIFVIIGTPTLSVLLIIVIFFDYLMSRARASDTDDETHLMYADIAKVEIIVMAINLTYWVPFLIML